MIIINKRFFKDCAQLMINSYNGEYGPVINILEEVEHFNIKNTDGYIGKNKNSLYIVFQGSHGLSDWIDDFELWPKKLPFKVDDKDMFIHNGFLEQWNNVREYIIELINKNSNKDIIIIGHSLGSAIASICAFDLSVTQKINTTVVLFASPKVGGLHFVKSYKKYVPHTYGFSYGNDIVTRVPPMWLFYFKHYKTIWLSKGISYIKYILNNPIAFLIGNPLDHYPNLYKEGVDYMKIKFK